MSASSQSRPSTAPSSDVVWWISTSSVQTTAHPPSAFTPRIAANEVGWRCPMPLQWGTWKKRFRADLRPDLHRLEQHVVAGISHVPCVPGAIPVTLPRGHFRGRRWQTRRMRFLPTSSSRPAPGATPWRRVLPVALLTTGLLVAACSGGDSKGDATTSPDTIDLSGLPSTTEGTLPATTTTALATTTTEAPAPTFPLTGMPLTDPALATRPAVVVKVGNYDQHPQRGTNLADIMYEEIINANVSRFAFVYQSQTAPEVGPVRSGRRQDVDLFGTLNRPMFAWAGGNKTVTNEIESSDLVDLSQFRARAPATAPVTTPREFTLMFNVDKVVRRLVHGRRGAAAAVRLPRRRRGRSGTLSAGVNLKMDSYKVDWTWNPTTGLYERTQNGRPTRTRAATCSPRTTSWC